MPGKERLIDALPCKLPLVVKNNKPHFVRIDDEGNRVYRDEPFLESRHLSSDWVIDEWVAMIDKDLIKLHRIYKASEGFWGSYEGKFIRGFIERHIHQASSLFPH